MKDYSLVCCDPFKSHKKKIVNGVIALPERVYSICQRCDLDISENKHICVNCLKKLQSQSHAKPADSFIEPKIEVVAKHADSFVEPKFEVVPRPTSKLGMFTTSAVVCCDPYKTHKKIITSGVCKLPNTMFLECQRLGINVEKDASICINCLKKLQYRNRANHEENAPEPNNIVGLVKVRRCLDPFKTHTKIITSGLCHLPEKLHRKCQSLCVDVADNAEICVNCLKKLQNKSCARMVPKVNSDGVGDHRSSMDSSVGLSNTEGDQDLSATERDLSFSREYLDEVVPSLAIGQVEMDGLSPASQITNIISKFRNVTPQRKRKLDNEAFEDSDVKGNGHIKKSRKMSAAKMNGSEAQVGRGALIILEGCDRTGKTTQAKKLVESLNAAGKPATFMRFPDRSTKIGSIIDSYLACSSELEDHSIHLLFSANRWELLPKIKSSIQNGTSVIIDRYAFSGVAFSAAKKGMSLDWCKQSDAGLPKPDLVLFLDLTAEEAQRRGQYGEERYEKADFQERVNANYKLLQDESWKIIDANKTIDDLQEELKTEVTKVIDSVGETKIGKLWV